MLIPSEFNLLDDVPWTFIFILNRAAFIKSFDNLAIDDRPPKEIWAEDKLLKKWFDDRNKQNPQQQRIENQNILYHKEF